MNYDKNIGETVHNKGGIKHFWNQYIMERFIKANLFIICCIAAGLLLIVYLAAFSCEVSWILEARGDLPFAAYILCTQFFIVFVATTILIHGLVTGLPWALFAWSVIIGLFSVPELIFVMIMTTQHWGLQSVHGLTELISYLVRLIINCLTLICVIPTALRWRRESQVLSQLQDLAARLQLQTPIVPVIKNNDSRRSSTCIHDHMVFDNSAYKNNESSKHQIENSKAAGLPSFAGSQNEFNASLFSQPFVQLYNSQTAPQVNRAQSLMDLRCTLPGMYNPRYVIDNNDDGNGKYFNVAIDDLKHNVQHSGKTSQTPSLIGSVSNDPIYCSIEPRPESPPHKRIHADKKKTSKMRNCVSLENLDGISKVQNDLNAYGHNLLQNYNQQQQQMFLRMLSGYTQPNNLSIYRRPSTGGFTGTIVTPPPRTSQHQQLQYYNGFGYANYQNPFITANSKLSLGNESDDYRKYRDVAL